MLLRTKSARTVKTDLERLVSAWAWARRIGAVPDRALDRVRMKVPRPEKYTPTAGEVARVLAAVEIPWRAFGLRLLFATGARTGEIAALTRADVFAEQLEIRVDGKTGPRRVPVSRETTAAILAHLETHDHDRVLGVAHGSDGLCESLRDACAAAGVPVFTPKGLRRAVIDKFYRAGVDVATCASFVGHSPRVALEYYRQATESDLRGALTRARLGALVEDDNVVQLRVGEG